MDFQIIGTVLRQSLLIRKKFVNQLDELRLFVVQQLFCDEWRTPHKNQATVFFGVGRSAICLRSACWITIAHRIVSSVALHVVEFTQSRAFDSHTRFRHFVCLGKLASSDENVIIVLPLRQYTVVSEHSHPLATNARGNGTTHSKHMPACASYSHACTAG